MITFAILVAPKIENFSFYYITNFQVVSVPIPEKGLRRDPRGDSIQVNARKISCFKFSFVTQSVKIHKFLKKLNVLAKNQICRWIQKTSFLFAVEHLSIWRKLFPKGKFLNSSTLSFSLCAIGLECHIYISLDQAT